jgi:hypothetical protein
MASFSSLAKGALKSAFTAGYGTLAVGGLAACGGAALFSGVLAASAFMAVPAYVAANSLASAFFTSTAGIALGATSAAAAGGGAFIGKLALRDIKSIWSEAADGQADKTGIPEPTADIRTFAAINTLQGFNNP